MGFFSVLVDGFAPLLYVVPANSSEQVAWKHCPRSASTDTTASLVLSPITSYADQIVSIHRRKTSDGFSLDIPLIMLLASILKLFYWFGARYDSALLFQAILMIVVQSILLKVAVDNKPHSGTRDNIGHRPFVDHAQTIISDILEGRRPYNFWRWNVSKPYVQEGIPVYSKGITMLTIFIWGVRYFQFLAYVSGVLLGIQFLIPPLAHAKWYVEFLGYIGLAIEATLPIPQILKNQNARSCKGFRLSVIGNWLAGDTLKMSYFFFSNQFIPWPFRLCGIFQAVCDVYLGLQFYMYGDGSDVPDKIELR